MITPYKHTINTLRKLTSQQLVEMMDDIDDFDTINMLAIVANDWLHTCKHKHEVSDEQDAINVDNARRARELK